MEQEVPLAAVAGHICLDMTPIFGRMPGASVGEILRPGKLLQMEGVRVSPGGPVANTGLALRRLGIPAALMGKCGPDPFGRVLRDAVRAVSPGAETHLRVVEGAATSYTVVIAPPGIDRMFLHCPAANDTFGPEDLDLDVVAQSQLLHFGYLPVMRRMYADDGAEAEELLRSVADTGVITSLDVSLPDPDSDAGRADWGTILGRVLPYVDIFLPSLDEILYMLDRGRFDELISAGASIADSVEADELRQLADSCLGMGTSVVVVKCGHAGAYLRTSSLKERAAARTAAPELWQEREIYEPSCRVASIASATGAGDSAIAGFLAAFLKGEPPERCMAFLTAVGAQNLAEIDAVSGLKSWEETVADLEAGLPKNPLPPGLKQIGPSSD